ncbi:MAG: riboflavin synthase [Nocardioidaceae bacterium]|nr:riboflavin synthase [Nocardioidaceae bacterium]
MFTGIIEELGTVAGIEDQGDAVRLTITAETVLGDAALGDSISVNGCCLTVSSVGSAATDGGLDGGTHTAALFTADVMRETLDKTGVGSLRIGDRVNLERAVTPQTRLGGHIVQGHVDATGSVRRRTPSEHWELVEVAAPRDLMRYVVAKGSITVDGISLTVVDLLDDGFTVSLIPETLARTTLGFRQPGDTVNLEVDVIAKHVERLLTWRDTP